MDIRSGAIPNSFQLVKQPLSSPFCAVIIHLGCDWETGIAEGLNWAKEANDDGRMLLFITPHALRRPDGYCLNEIARGRKKE